MSRILSPGLKRGPPTPGLVCNVILKAVLLFLIVIGVLAMFGKMRMPDRRMMTGKCPDCGRYRFGKGPCLCKEPRS